MIELLTDPAAWVGLVTLVLLEIVLGIDNLIFIAILAEKLPPHQRDRARVIGLSLVTEGLGFHLPKGYLYGAIGFSVMIEAFNQWARRNAVRHEARRPLRDRTAESAMRLLGGRARGDAPPPWVT